MAAYRRVDDLRSPAGWLPVHRDQLRAQRSVSSMGKPLAFINLHKTADYLNVRTPSLDDTKWNDSVRMHKAVSNTFPLTVHTRDEATNGEVQRMTW